jgi:hypothetical protein
MPRKSKWTLIVVAIAAVALALTSFRAGPPQENLLKVAFIGFTNVPDLARPLAVFAATNTSSKTMWFLTHIERRTATGWPSHTGLEPYLGKEVSPHQEFRFLERPPVDNEPWRVCVVYMLSDDKWGRIRRDVADFLYTHNFPSAAPLIYRHPRPSSAVGPEMRK